MFCKMLLPLFCVTMALSGEQPAWSIDGKEQGWKETAMVKAYFHHSELQRQWASELLGKVYLKGDEKILDFGAGDGKITAEISHRLQQGSIKGVDSSKEMVRFANLLFPSSHYPKVDFAEIQAPSDLKEQFDLIFSFCVFHLLPDPYQILVELKDLLSAEGHLCLVIPCGKNPEFFQAAEETFAKFNIPSIWQKKKMHGVDLKSIDGCREVLERAQYQVDHLEMVDTDNLFLDTSELLEWFRGTYTANWGIPLALCDPFFTAVIDRMKELDPHFIDENGVVHLKFSRLLVVARR